MRKNLPLLVILLFAFVLRVSFLSKAPFSFNQDEASQAYSAYSLLKTGRDEWGTSWPITSFRSFLDYKAPLLSYLMIPSIAVFGLNEFAARLPSAIIGTLAVLVIYFLANQLLPLTKGKVGKGFFSAGHLAALLLTISPWHLQFSRSAMEANLISLLFPLGLYLFLKSFDKQKFLIFSAVSWGLSLYAYHSAKIFLPLFVFGAVILYLKKLIKFPKKILFAAVILLAVLSIPIYSANIFGEEGRRGSELLVTNLTDREVIEIANNQYYSSLKWLNPALPRIFHNKATYSLNRFVKNLFSYYSPTFWFTEGSGDQSYANIPGRGLLYLWQFPFVLLALFILVKDRFPLHSKLLLLWLVFATLPAAITKDGYHANRAAAFLTLLEIFVAFGIVTALPLLKRFHFLTVGMIAAAAFSFIFFLENYFISYPINFPGAMSDGWPQAIKYTLSIDKDYAKVKLEPRYELQAYIAFFRPIDPREFQMASVNWWQKYQSQKEILYLDQLSSYNLGKYYFDSFHWPDDIDKDTLYVAKANQGLPTNRHTLQIIKAVTQEPLVEIFDFKNE